MTVIDARDRFLDWNINSEPDGSFEWPMSIVNCEQGSEEWFGARRGVLTASNFKRIVDTKGNPSRQAQDYIDELVGEAITGESHQRNQGDGAHYWMDRGIELEDEARNHYMAMTDQQVDEVGFCLFQPISIGCSPDGLIGDTGGIEIKCPSAKIHNKYLREARVPPAYYQQIMGSLLVTGRDWWDFLSYHPSYKRQLRITVERDDDYIKKMYDLLTAAADKIALDIQNNG